MALLTLAQNRALRIDERVLLARFSRVTDAYFSAHLDAINPSLLS